MEIKINTDVSKYKTKDFLMFSRKEIPYVVVAVVAFVLLKLLTKNAFGEESELGKLLPLLGCAIPLAFGFWKPKGYKLSVCIKKVWIPSITSVREKRWENDFNEDDLIEEGEINYEDFGIINSSENNGN